MNLSSEKKIVDLFVTKKDSNPDMGRLPHWNSFYEEGNIPIAPSSFCELVNSKTKQGQKLLEIGCGNGRDSFFFGINGKKVTGIDMSQSAILECKKNILSQSINFYEGKLDEIKELNSKKFDIIYSRFVLHAMTVQEEILMLKKGFEVLYDGGQIFIECRSILDPLSRLGEIISSTERMHGHYRRFIIKDELIERLTNIGFIILDVVEDDNLAKYKDDNPVVIRVIAKK